MLGTLYLRGDHIAAARTGEIGAAVEHPVIEPACGDVVAVPGVGTRGVAGDQIVYFQAILDRLAVSSGRVVE
jgi:hypothetical protein